MIAAKHHLYMQYTFVVVYLYIRIYCCPNLSLIYYIGVVVRYLYYLSHHHVEF